LRPLDADLGQPDISSAGPYHGYQLGALPYRYVLVPLRPGGPGQPSQRSEPRQSSSAIAARLNAEGFRPPKRTQRFTAAMVQRLTLRLGLSRRQRHGSREGLGRHEYRPTELAHRLGTSRHLVRRSLRVGWLNVRRDEDGHHIIWADADELRRLRALHRLPRTWVNKARLAELKKPKQRPAR
jgi:hypothetical protein